MLKFPSRCQRSKGFKVKHVIQACLFLAICFWLLNQVKLSYDKHKAYVYGAGGASEMVMGKNEMIKLGRKDLDHQVLHASTVKFRGTARKEEVEEDGEESDDDGRGGGDDEIDGNDQERAEDDEVEGIEDLIDEEDRERKDESEELELDRKGNQMEDVDPLEDQADLEGEWNLHAARKEHYKGDDASSEVLQSNHASSYRENSKVEEEKPELKTNLRLLLVESLSAFEGKDILSKPTHFLSRTSQTGQTFSEAVVLEQNGKSSRTSKNSTSSTRLVNFDDAKRDKAVDLEMVRSEQHHKHDGEEITASGTTEHVDAAQNK